MRFLEPSQEGLTSRRSNGQDLFIGARFLRNAAAGDIPFSTSLWIAG